MANVPAPKDQPTLKPSVALVGVGAVGSALAEAVHNAGYPLRALVTRRARQATALAKAWPEVLVTNSLDDLPASVQLVLCCVPDDRLATLADALAAMPRDWSGTAVAHTSGLRTATVLAPLASKGAAVFSFHPVQTFPPNSSAATFAGIHIGLEGSEDGIACGQRLAEDLGATAFVLATAAKTRYHLAASLASNALVTLMAVVGEIHASAGIDPDVGAALLRPLVTQTWENLAQQPPELVLTGPIARGDVQTLNGHLDALRQHTPQLLPVYAALAIETIRLAVRGRKLTMEAAERMLDEVQNALDASSGLPFTP